MDEDEFEDGDDVEFDPFGGGIRIDLSQVFNGGFFTGRSRNRPPFNMNSAGKSRNGFKGDMGMFEEMMIQHLLRTKFGSSQKRKQQQRAAKAKTKMEPEGKKDSTKGKKSHREDGKKSQRDDGKKSQRDDGKKSQRDDGKRSQRDDGKKPHSNRPQATEQSNGNQKNGKYGKIGHNGNTRNNEQNSHGKKKKRR